MTIVVELHARDEYIFIVQLLAIVYGTSQWTIVLIMISDKFTFIEFIHTCSSANNDVLWIARHHIKTVDVNIPITCLFADILLISSPVVAVVNLYDARIDWVGNA